MPTKSNNTGGRGGKRPGAGRKKKAVLEKAENGNPGGRPLKVLDIPDIEGVEMPKPHDFLSADQRDGNPLQAKEIYEETWNWLKGVEVDITARVLCMPLSLMWLLDLHRCPGAKVENAERYLRERRFWGRLE